ncbi:MAG: thiamine pyrophosphate-dependent enzyme [Minisyncoccia bacterium]
MSQEKLLTNAKITWCPGCTNFIILNTFKDVIGELEKKGIKRENIIFTTGIGCHGKIFDYLNLNSFYGLHGRAIPLAEGIKIANKNLIVLSFVGDGDTYNEGISHLIHAAKRNSDIKVFVFDNRNFALTVSQFTATSPKGFKGSSTPKGSVEEPFNPIELVLASGATFVARTFALKREHLKNIIAEAILHKGFSFVEILQPCITFFDNREFYTEKTYELSQKDLTSKEKAMEKAREWNYKDEEGKIPIGIFYKIEKPTFEE